MPSWHADVCTEHRYHGARRPTALSISGKIIHKEHATNGKLTTPRCCCSCGHRKDKRSSCERTCFASRPGQLCTTNSSRDLCALRCEPTLAMSSKPAPTRPVRTLLPPQHPDARRAEEQTQRHWHEPGVSSVETSAGSRVGSPAALGDKTHQKRSKPTSSGDAGAKGVIPNACHDRVTVVALFFG